MKQLLTEVDTWIRRKILGNLLETVEEGANKVPHDTPLRDSRMESAWTGKLPKRTMESGAYAELGPYEQKNSPPWLYNHDELLQISLWKRGNRRASNGTHGGVRGRDLYLEIPPTRISGDCYFTFPFWRSLNESIQ